MTVPGFHHVELWVADLPRARREGGWLLGGPDHYAGWLEDSAGAKAEIVADER